jgi:hypothetical protein
VTVYRIGLATVTSEVGRCVTRYDDGAELVAVSVYDEESVARARSLGYGQDPWGTALSDEHTVDRMTGHHDLLHSLLAHAKANAHPRAISPVLWFRAHGWDHPDPLGAQQEEATVMLLHRLATKGLYGPLRDLEAL